MFHVLCMGGSCVLGAVQGRELWVGVVQGRQLWAGAVKGRELWAGVMLERQLCSMCCAEEAVVGWCCAGEGVVFHVLCRGGSCVPCDVQGRELGAVAVHGGAVFHVL